MPNAFATSAQPQSRNAMSLGTGLAQGSSDLIRLRKLWQDQYSQGETELQFREWLEANGVSNPTLAR